MPFKLFLVLYIAGSTEQLYIVHHTSVRAADGWFRVAGYFRAPDRGRLSTDHINCSFRETAGSVLPATLELQTEVG